MIMMFLAMLVGGGVLVGLSSKGSSASPSAVQSPDAPDPTVVPDADYKSNVQGKGDSDAPDLVKPKASNDDDGSRDYANHDKDGDQDPKSDQSGGGHASHGGGGSTDTSGGNTTHDGGHTDTGGGDGGHTDTGDGGHSDTGHGDGDGGHHEPIAIPLPTTDAEIQPYIDAVRASPEAHIHNASSPLSSEHMAAISLAPRDEATHIAIGNGDWDDPSNWYNGEVPGDDARVLIPDGVTLTYGEVSDARLFTLRVDGHLKFADDVDSKMVVDTIIISPTGELTIGTEANPIPDNVNIDIVFANNGPIDTDWDPMLLSRGMIAHGAVNIHGAVKDSHEKVIDDPQAGDTSIQFADVPEGWQVGDTIVIAGTHYDGYYGVLGNKGYAESEDEVRVITQIEGGRIHFDEALKFDHDSPRADLKTSVANYTRNVSFETEDAETAEIFERGHVMFMHNDEVDVRYAEFHELGRTDKSETALNVSEFDDIAFDTNVKGRYAFHFHRAGMDDIEDPGVAVGNAVFGSPGWGFVHHDSNAILDNNATFDTFGAGYVAESGNETGVWSNNIAIFAKGTSWLDPKLGNDAGNFDLGKTGDGFWFQGRMVESTDNIAASVNNGFVYFHRGGIADDRMINIDAEVSPISGPLFNDPLLSPDHHPIIGFSGNETIASNTGLYILKANPIQGHDVHSVLEDFTAWNINMGISMAYTARYTFKDIDLIGNEASQLSGAAHLGVSFGSNTSDITFVDSTIENFGIGMDLVKHFLDPSLSPEAHAFNIVDVNFIDVTQDFRHYDPALDNVTTAANLPNFEPDLELDGPLTFTNGGTGGSRFVNLNGTKTDSFGETDFSGEIEDFRVDQFMVKATMEKEGFYTTTDGDNFFMLDVYFSDRLTGDIYVETHPVFLEEADKGRLHDENDSFFGNVPFNGVVDLGGADDPTIDTAILWATLTNGQPVLTDEAIAMLDDEHVLEDIH